MSTSAADNYLFVCDSPERMRSACLREVFFKEREGKRYCVLHYPGVEKTEEFDEALDRKLEVSDCNFNGVWFPTVSFRGKTLTEASFKEAHFSSTVDFSQMKFSKPVDFSEANFRDYVNFTQTNFAEYVDFHRTNFGEHVDFSQTNFAAEVDFSEASFEKQVDFSQTNFRQRADFSQTKVVRQVDFNQTNFGESVDFRGAQLTDGSFQYANFVSADFTGAKFGLANFVESTFTQAHFVNAVFSGDAFFNPIKVAETTNFRGAKFSGKAYFGKATLKDTSFSDAEFAGLVDFGEVEFANSDFEKARLYGRANFGEARFGGDVVFRDTKFTDVDFRKAQFNGPANFQCALFSDDANFGEALFTRDVLFGEAEFGQQLNFFKTRFVPNIDSDKRGESDSAHPAAPRKVSFDSARFKDTFVFESCELIEARLSFASATAENPSRISFHSVNLRPIWLIRFDSQDLQFQKVRWQKLWRGRIIPAEIQTLEQEKVSTPYESLEIVCRQLAVNAEEHNRYEEAARLRFVANEAHRRETWHNLWEKPRVWESWKGLNPFLWLYGAVSGYGERAWQAAGVLVAIWFLFALVFYFGQNTEQQWWRPPPSPAQNMGQPGQHKEAAQPDGPQPLLRDFGEAMLYSANVIALQKPEPLPGNKRAKFLVLFETLLGPLQLALLALAIRRKFMR